MFKKSPGPILLIVIFLFLSLISVFYFLSPKQDIVFVDNAKLFNEFKMTKELMKAGDKELLKMKDSLDSLYLSLNTTVDPNVKSQIVQEIIKEKQLIGDFQNNYSITNSQAIWKRINGYVKDFSEKNDCKLMIGSQANGGVFYGNPDIEVTKAVLVYINKRYEGFNQ